MVKRPVLIAGNWKMNQTPSETKELLYALLPDTIHAQCDIVVCPSFVCLPEACQIALGSTIAVGAQNCHFEKSGAYTGEVSVQMLRELGVSYVILGHSERRQYFAETDETVNKKLKTVLAAELKAIVCVGESLAQREQGQTEVCVTGQVKAALSGIPAEQLSLLSLAYEPIWAIGTGKTATAQQADDVCALIRAVVGELYGKGAAEKLVVQYGGSMNAGNAQELLSMPNVDGGLIGGASLKAQDFLQIVAAGDARLARGGGAR